MDHQWEYGSLGPDMSRHRSCRRCRVMQRAMANGDWDDEALLDWRLPGVTPWEAGAAPECSDPAAMPRDTEWKRVEGEHPRWEIRNPKGDGGNFLCTDVAIRTYGREHVEGRLLRGLPPLPEEAWEVLGEQVQGG